MHIGGEVDTASSSDQESLIDRRTRIIRCASLVRWRVCFSRKAKD
jgi:hypothetical protein